MVNERRSWPLPCSVPSKIYASIKCMAEIFWLVIDIPKLTRGVLMIFSGGLANSLLSHPVCSIQSLALNLTCLSSELGGKLLDCTARKATVEVITMIGFLQAVLSCLSKSRKLSQPLLARMWSHTTYFIATVCAPSCNVPIDLCNHVPAYA